MVTIDHTFKVAGRIFSDGAKIDMYTHDDADSESCHNMKEVGQIKAAKAKKTVYGNFRVKKPIARKNDKGNQAIHKNNIGNLLQGIEFTFLSYRKRGVFLFEDPDGIVEKLVLQPDKKAFNRDHIISSIGSKQVAQEKCHIAY
jgi:hypothetical protein